MAILAIFTGNISKAQYEALRQEIKWETEQPPGVVLHVAGFDDAGGIHVADIWESAETMNAFVEQRLVPAFNKFGIAPPSVAVYPAHNIDAYKAIEKHMI